MTDKCNHGHSHGEDHNCCGGGHHGHSHDHSHDDGIELETITLVFSGEDDDEEVEVECGVIGIFEHGKKEYIALVVPEEDGENLEEVIYIYEYSEDEEGSPILDNIATDEEYDEVVETFSELYEGE